MAESEGEQVWAFDLEWVPDPQAGRVLYGAVDDPPDRDVMRTMWRHGGATVEEPRPFLKTVVCRIVSIAAVRRSVSPDGVRIDLFSLPAQPSDARQADERAMLKQFFEVLSDFQPTLVGFNSQSGDLKILQQRAVVHGLSAGALFCSGENYFDGDPRCVVDLMRVLGGWGKGTPSLHEMATLCGIPGKLDTNGADVARLWLEGDRRRIVDYNQCDAVTTYLLWLRMAHFRGRFTPAEYDAEQDRVRRLLVARAGQSDGQHARTYLQEWDRLAELHANGVCASRSACGRSPYRALQDA